MTTNPPGNGDRLDLARLMAENRAEHEAWRAEMAVKMASIDRKLDLLNERFLKDSDPLMHHLLSTVESLSQAIAHATAAWRSASEVERSTSRIQQVMETVARQSDENRLALEALAKELSDR